MTDAEGVVASHGDPKSDRYDLTAVAALLDADIRLMFAAAFPAAAVPVRHIGTVRHTGAPTPWYSACHYSCYPSGCELGWINIGKARRPQAAV